MSGRRPRWIRLAARGPRLAVQFARWGFPRRALLFGPHSLGDDLLCSAVLHEARRRGAPLAMMTARPELFAGSPDPERVIPIDDHYVAALRRLGARVIQPYYASAAPAEPDRDLFPDQHIIAEMCRLSGLHGRVELRPRLYLTPAERARGALHPRQIALHSSAAAAVLPFANKEWGAGRFAATARLLSPEFRLVQIGSAGDPALPVDTDLRGRTGLRETAAVLAGSAAFIGLEGFLGHLARAVDCPAAIVLGGRARPATVGYAANRNFYAPVPCAPCGLRSTCGHGLACMARISPEEVAAAARELAGRDPGPLPVETVELP